MVMHLCYITMLLYYSNKEAVKGINDFFIDLSGKNVKLVLECNDHL